VSKKTAYIIFILVLLLACFSAYELFSRKNVSNNGNSINTVGDDIRQAGNELDTITSGIDNAQRTSQDIEQSAIRIEAINGSSTELIERGKQIVKDVRNGNQAGTAASTN
jgi:hypothetical protein